MYLYPHCFSRLASILFPTLIAACYKDENNLTILRKEMSPILLCKFIAEKSVNEENSAQYSHFGSYNRYLPDVAPISNNFTWPFDTVVSPLPAPTKIGRSSLLYPTPLFLYRSDFGNRFSVELWKSAEAWFRLNAKK